MATRLPNGVGDIDHSTMLNGCNPLWICKRSKALAGPLNFGESSLPDYGVLNRLTASLTKFLACPRADSMTPIPPPSRPIISRPSDNILATAVSVMNLSDTLPELVHVR